MTPDVLLLRKLMSREDLTREESAELLVTLLRTDTEGWRLLAFSVASQTKGETLDELLGMFDALRTLTGDYALHLDGRRPLDVSSSGGSGVRKINISTLTSLVVGDPETPVIKQSFWRMTNTAGSAGMLAAVGILTPSVTLPQIQQAVDEVGVAFYSPLFVSPELGNLVQFGRELNTRQVGINTPFNLVAPLFTPVPLQARMFGTNNPTQFELILSLFKAFGYRSGLVLRGFDGMDEASLASPTRVQGFRGDEEIDFVLLPEEVGLRRVAPEEIQPEHPNPGYRDFVRIVFRQETGPKRDLVALNAGLAFWISERVPSIEEGVRLALTRLESGVVEEKLTRLVELIGSPDVLRQARELHLSS
jgi:anthranilate phosphoribosyltransferase